MLQTLIYLLILLFGVLSYAVGIKRMLNGKYKPNTFSRIIWLLLSINSFAGVWLGGGSDGSIVLAGLLLAGNVAMCTVSLRKGVWEFGLLEKFCLTLLAISGLIWIFFDAPLVNLIISLTAHFIGALPTYRRVIKRSDSEDAAFWILFAISSGLSVVANGRVEVSAIILPLYYVLFDLSIFVLTLRGRRGQNS